MSKRHPNAPGGRLPAGESPGATAKRLQRLIARATLALHRAGLAAEAAEAYRQGAASAKALGLVGAGEDEIETAAGPGGETEGTPS